MHIANLFETEPALREKARNLKAEPDGPFPILSAKIKLTWQCNLRCLMCTIWREPRTKGQAIHLPPDIVKQVLSHLKEKGLRKIHFSGGEVLLYKGFKDVVAFARSLGLQVNLTTNGTLITKDLARFFVEERVHTVTVSLDGPDAETHDRIRGVKGAFKATVNGMALMAARKLKKGRGPIIAVNTVVSRKTMDLLDAMYDLLCETKVQAWRILPIDTEIRSLRPTQSQWEAMFTKVPAWSHLLSRLPLDWSSERSGHRAEGGKYAGLFYGDRVCFAPWFNLFVDADGRVYPCCNGKQDMRPYGNLNEIPAPQALESQVRREIRYSMASGHPFPICDCCDDFLEENQAFHLLSMKKGVAS
ncbi:MAG: radical SAM protein [Proteobacteria bacterium]|nr:radical SAM protein [Pseudomonadota bacterium]